MGAWVFQAFGVYFMFCVCVCAFCFFRLRFFNSGCSLGVWKPGALESAEGMAARDDIFTGLPENPKP